MKTNPPTLSDVLDREGESRDKTIDKEVVEIRYIIKGHWEDEYTIKELNKFFLSSLKKVKLEVEANMAQSIVRFGDEKVADGRRYENKDWMEGRRCSNCGGVKEQDPLSDMCRKCWEEA